MLSIIIPTLNEEDYLPLLLKSIKRQEPIDCEIIVADAGSKDNTVKIAQQFGCRVIQGGLPARGRNNGAKIAQGDLLFFLDADTVLPKHFFKKALKEFRSRKLDVASFFLFFQDKKRNHYFLDVIYNKMIIVLEKKMPFSIIGVFIKKDLFTKLHGYNEAIKISEDSDLGLRAMKMKARFGIIRSTKIFISDRRFIKDGWFKSIVTYFLAQLHTTFIGPVESDIFKYKFDHYKEK